MEGVYVILFIFGLGFVFGWLVTRLILNKRHSERVRNIENENQILFASRINDKNDQISKLAFEKDSIIERLESEKEDVIEKFRVKETIRAAEHNDLKNELRQVIETNKVKSKSILVKAVEYAFNFEHTFFEQHKTAQADIQRVLDDTYRYKRKTLLSAISLKNFERKLEEMKKEKAIYQSLIAKYEFFELKDNSDWKGVEKEFRGRVLELQEALDEREAQNELKRQMREERQRVEELEKQQKEAEARELELEERRKAIEEALLAADEEHRAELERTRQELEQEIEDVHKQYERAKSMAQMTKQGHVYIISNIGSFGEGIYKIGMTRRLEPHDRINELSGASVPFEFDVHAMISCDDAPALESALHNALGDHRLNKVNLRKEFFKADLEKIIECVEENHGTVEYVANPAALQYLRSLEIEESNAEMVAA